MCRRCARLCRTCQYPNTYTPPCPSQEEPSLGGTTSLATAELSSRLVNSTQDDDNFLYYSPAFLDQSPADPFSDALLGFLDPMHEFASLGTEQPFDIPQPSSQSSQAHTWDDTTCGETPVPGHCGPRLHQLAQPFHGSKHAPSHETQKSGQMSTQLHKFSRRSVDALRRTKPDRPILLEFWPRVRETETWMFCARELYSYIGLYAKTASTPFISISGHQQQDDGLQSPLGAALGICAAHETLSDANRPAFSQILSAEVCRLMESADTFTTLSISGNLDTYGPDEKGRPLRHPGIFREELARVQALALYQIIRVFGSDARQKRLAEQHEPILAAWTTSLQLRLQNIERGSAPSALSSPSPTPLLSGPSVEQEGSDGDIVPWQDTNPLQKEEIQCAHQAVLISYFVRAVYSVIAYRVCPLILDLEPLLVSLPSRLAQQQGFGLEQGRSVRLPQQQRHQTAQMVSYRNLIDLWEQGSMSGADLDDGCTKLLLVACKGTSILP